MPYNLSNLTTKLNDLKMQRDAVESASDEDFNELIKCAYLNDLDEQINELNTSILDQAKLTGRLFRGRKGVYLCVGRAHGYIHFVKRNASPVMISYSKIHFVDNEHYEINGEIYCTDGKYFEASEKACGYLEHIETYTDIRCKKLEVLERQKMLLKEIKPQNYGELEDKYFETSAQIKDFDELVENFEKIMFRDLKRIRENDMVGIYA